MSIIGIRRGGAVEVGVPSPDGTQVTVLAGLAEFWDDAPGWLARTPDGPTLALADVVRVPPVLPAAGCSAPG